MVLASAASLVQQGSKADSDVLTKWAITPQSPLPQGRFVAVKVDREERLG